MKGSDDWGPGGGGGGGGGRGGRGFHFEAIIRNTHMPKSCRILDLCATGDHLGFPNQYPSYLSPDIGVCTFINVRHQFH